MVIGNEKELFEALGHNCRQNKCSLLLCHLVANGYNYVFWYFIFNEKAN
jgi:hypothetical protein